MIDDLHLLGEIVLDLKARLCFSKNKPCEQEVIILQSFRLPKPLCNFSPGNFAIPGEILYNLNSRIIMYYMKLKKNKNIQLCSFRF
jgi:hypothetical protein